MKMRYFICLLERLHIQQGRLRKTINQLEKENTARYLLNVRDEISRKISTMVVEDAIDPALLQVIFMYDFYDVTLFEVKKSGFGRHVIVQSPDILHFLKKYTVCYFCLRTYPANYFEQ